MARIVIGSSGFIGSRLCASLGATGVDRNTVDLTEPSAKNILAPLVSGKACVFCANTDPAVEGWDRAKDHKILEPFLAVANSCAHITYLSSDMVYPYDELITERTDVDPDSSYGKLHLERESALYDKVGDKLLIARLSQVYGAGDTHNAYGPCRMVRQALEGGPIVVKGKGEERRDHIHIRDVVAILADLIDHEVTGILNVATGSSLSFLEVANKAHDVLPSSIEYEERQVPIKHRDFDISRLLEVCPWYKPSPMSFDDMIENHHG